MGVGAGLYMCDVVVKSSRSLSHLLMSSCYSTFTNVFLFVVTFLRFLTFFIFWGERFFIYAYSRLPLWQPGFSTTTGHPAFKIE